MSRERAKGAGKDSCPKTSKNCTLIYAHAWRTRVNAKFGSVNAHFLGRDELIAEKTFFDRPQDRADVAALRAKPSRAKPSRAKRARPQTPRRRS